eukprot:1156208-Pelagomonas_calceolata.AAC.2
MVLDLGEEVGFMRNVFANIMQLMRVWEVKRLGMSGRRLMRLRPIGAVRSLAKRVPGHHKVGFLTSRWKAVFRWS